MPDIINIIIFLVRFWSRVSLDTHPFSTYWYQCSGVAGSVCEKLFIYLFIYYVLLYSKLVCGVCVCVCGCGCVCVVCVCVCISNMTIHYHW